MRTFLLSLVTTFTMATSSMSQNLKVLPVDDSHRDPTLAQFRAQLLDAALRNDTTFIFGVLSPEILNGFGGDGGIEEFKKIYWPDPALRRNLIRALRLGGRLREDGITYRCPYAWALLPPGSDMEDALVVGKDVNVRNGPSRTDTTAFKISYELVRILEWPADAQSWGWSKVRTQDGRTGWINGEFLCGPFDYRFFFQKTPQGWKWISWACGD